tara:strand:+ start:205 stop:501 length:297 start_codon:yes stop_codon:yes gene_type:complete
MNDDAKKRILAIQVEMGMMVMALMAEAGLDERTETMTLHVISAMQGETAKLLNLTMDEVKEVWKETKCGIRDLRAKMTHEQAKELADVLLNNNKEAQA